MATIADLVVTQPSASHGVPLGHASWRLVVELLTPTSGGGVWGQEYGTVWGTPTVWATGWEWVDITADVRGGSYQRGSESIADRPRVGTAQIELDNNGGDWSPWKRYTYPYLDIGSVIRIAWNDPSATGAEDVKWFPRFTGRVESVTESQTDLDADRRVNITLTESIADLAKIDGNAQTAEGAGDTVATRLIRLLDDAAFRFPYTNQLTTADALLTINDSTLYANAFMQATNYSQNRLSDMYLTADSGLCHVFSHRDGSIRLESQRDFSQPAASYQWGEIGQGTPYFVVPWTDFEVLHDEEGIVTEASIACVGGTVSTYSTIGKTGPIRFARSDLIYDSDSLSSTYALLLVTETRSRYKTQKVQLSFDTGTRDTAPTVWEAIAGLDILQLVYVYREQTRQGGTDKRKFRVQMLAESHQFTPLNTAAVQWSGSYQGVVITDEAMTGYGTP